jgi:CheY-like chemotaxis protein/HPt (histidine-containing phosphotransfer) domain-containing protein
LRFSSSPLEFKLEVGDNVPEVLIGDVLRIKQVLNNLLSNAFKYTSRGVVVLLVTAETDIGDDDDILLVFVVRDTGHGMTAEQIDKLFERFTRFNLETNRVIEGVGLGMSITKMLVSMMNGRIEIESELGKGSTFTITLPQRLNGMRSVMNKDIVQNLQQTRITSAAQVKRTQILREYMPYGSVLIVDDTEANLYVAKVIMLPYGLKIDTAENGYEAIEKIKAGNVYDIIFMDHMMPGLNGIEAVRNIRDMGYTQPIIALTANAVVGQADIFYQNGFDDFISKPIDMRILDTALNKYIRDKQTHEILVAAQAEKETMEAQAQAVGADPGSRQTGGWEALPFDILGLNISRGLALFGDNMSTYLLALHSFVKNVPEMLDKLRGVTEENLSEYAIHVHGFKSISGWISADGLQARAASLEILAKAGDYAGVMKLNDILLQEAENFTRDLDGQLIDMGVSD